MNVYRVYIFVDHPIIIFVDRSLKTSYSNITSYILRYSNVSTAIRCTENRLKHLNRYLKEFLITKLANCNTNHLTLDICNCNTRANSL